MRKFISLISRPFSQCRKWWDDLTSMDFLCADVPYPPRYAKPYPPPAPRDQQNTMNSILKAAVEVADDATTLARDLLEKWYVAEVHRIDLKWFGVTDKKLIARMTTNKTQYYKEQDEIEGRYLEYRRKLDRIERQ